MDILKIFPQKMVLIMKKIINSAMYILLFCLLLLISCDEVVDHIPPNSESGYTTFVSGSGDGTAYDFAKGFIRSAEDIFGLFMENNLTSGSIENAYLLANGNAYLGLVQEDVYEYAKKKYLDQYVVDPDTAEKKYIAIASRIKTLMAAYKRQVFLLVNTNMVTDIYDATNNTTGTDNKITLEDLTNMSSQVIINCGPEDSDTYITAKTIIDAHEFQSAPLLTIDDNKTSIEKVVDGASHAAFIITTHPSPLLKSLKKNDPVELIRVFMPEDKKVYREDGFILENDYAFQNSSVADSITVRTLLVHGPTFNNDKLKLFLDNIYKNADSFKNYHAQWETVNKKISQEYMLDNPEKANYYAFSYIFDQPILDPLYVDPLMLSGDNYSTQHTMATELMWLLSYNNDIDLRERNTTGSWENAYWIHKGGGTMAMVQDNLFPYLKSFNDLSSAIMIASMQKIAPLNYEYVHILVNTEIPNWSSWIFTGTTNNIPSELTNNYLKNIFTHVNTLTPEIHINVGPKTSGTYATAMKILQSYANYDSDDDETTPDMQEFEIFYYFDTPSDAVAKVALGPDDGGYHMTFVTSGLPYHRFYSHDTYSIDTLSSTQIIPAEFYDANGNNDLTDDLPYPYEIGILKGGGTAVYENYPYPAALLPADITTLRVRSLLVASPVIEDQSIGRFLKSIYRKGYYKVHPLDPDDLDFSPDPLWIPIILESYEADDTTYYNTSYGSYGETVKGAKEYFINNPFGWSKNAVSYYLSLFPDN